MVIKMKKGWFALITLAALLTAVLLNIWHLDRMMGGLGETVESSRAYCEAGDFEKALKLVSEAAEKWVSADEYTHIVIRHSEIDGLTDAFFELIGQLSASDGEAASGSYEKLIYHLESIASMEHLTFGSIF